MNIYVHFTHGSIMAMVHGFNLIFLFNNNHLSAHSYMVLAFSTNNFQTDLFEQ